MVEELELGGYETDFLTADKLNKIKELQEMGDVVAMAGDGINVLVHCHGHGNAASGHCDNAVLGGYPDL